MGCSHLVMHHKEHLQLAGYCVHRSFTHLTTTKRVFRPTSRNRFDTLHGSLHEFHAKASQLEMLLIMPDQMGIGFTCSFLHRNSKEKVLDCIPVDCLSWTVCLCCVSAWRRLHAADLGVLGARVGHE